MNDGYKDNMEHAINAQRKYNYFFIGLTFSILALAINHDIDTKLIFPKIAELLGWLCLLISGFFGLSYIQVEGLIFKLAAHLAEARTQNDQENVEGIYNRLKGLDSKSQKKAIIQEWSFLTGVIFLVVSHGYPKIYMIFQYSSQ